MNLRHKISSVLTTAVLCLSALPLCSCGKPANDYAAYNDFDSDGWIYGQTIWFRPEHPDTLCPGRLAVALRHEGNFPYRNVWVETTVEDAAHPAADRPGHGTLRTDTLCIQLTDRYGAWTGSGISTSYQVIDTVSRPFLHRSGTLVGVRQIMRTDTLRGISQLGIFFIP